jgi:hypothetical protein
MQIIEQFIHDHTLDLRQYVNHLFERYKSSC